MQIFKRGEIFVSEKCTREPTNATTGMQLHAHGIIVMHPGAALSLAGFGNGMCLM